MWMSPDSQAARAEISSQKPRQQMPHMPQDDTDTDTLGEEATRGRRRGAQERKVVETDND